MIDIENKRLQPPLLTKPSQLSAEDLAAVKITEPGFAKEIISDEIVVDQSGELRQLRPEYAFDIARSKNMLMLVMAIIFHFINLAEGEPSFNETGLGLVVLLLMLPTLFFWLKQAERQYKHRRSVSLLYQKLAARQRKDKIQLLANITIDPEAMAFTPEEDSQLPELVVEVWTQSFSFARDLVFNYSLALTALYLLQPENRLQPDFFNMMAVVILIELARSSVVALRRFYQLRRWQKLVAEQKKLDTLAMNQAGQNSADEDDDDFAWEETSEFDATNPVTPLANLMSRNGFVG